MPALFGAAGGGGGGVPAPAGGMAAIGPLLPRQPPGSPAPAPGPGAGWSSPGPNDNRFNTTHYAPGTAPLDEAQIRNSQRIAREQAALRQRNKQEMRRAVQQFGGGTPAGRQQYKQDFWENNPTGEGWSRKPTPEFSHRPTDKFLTGQQRYNRVNPNRPGYSTPAPLGLGGR